jgi:DNA-binding NarL/FixJ family response regulator
VKLNSCLHLPAILKQEIAGRIFLSSHTIEKHRQRIMEKMDVKNAVKLVIYVLKNRW